MTDKGNFEAIFEKIEIELSRQRQTEPGLQTIRIPKVKFRFEGQGQPRVVQIIRRVWGARNSPRFFLGLFFRIPIVGWFGKWFSNIVFINKRLKQVEKELLQLQEMLVKTEEQVTLKFIQREIEIHKKIFEIEKKLS